MADSVRRPGRGISRALELFKVTGWSILRVYPPVQVSYQLLKRSLLAPGALFTSPKQIMSENERGSVNRKLWRRPFLQKKRRRKSQEAIPMYSFLKHSLCSRHRSKCTAQKYYGWATLPAISPWGPARCLEPC